jgi:hypothetical protein
MRLAARFAFLLVVLFAAARAEAIPLLTGFGGPAGYGVNCLLPNDDGWYTNVGGTRAGMVPSDAMGAVDITPAFPMGLNFFGMTHRATYFNNNGNITFRGPLGQFTPTPFPVAMQPMIAPWWGDVDTRGGGFPSRNAVCFHIESNRIIVTWHNVGYFASHDDRQNDFQLVLSTSSTCTSTGDFDVEFRYNRCEWTTGDASGGSMGFGGTPAQVGFDAGNRTDFVSLPMSRTMAILDVCRMSNVPGGAPGLWRFQIRGGGIAGGCMGAGMPCSVMGQQGVCGQGVTQCFGMGVRCVQVNFPRTRRCNGFDNDCDGMVDEGNELCPERQVCDRGACVDRCEPELGCLPGRTCTMRGTCIETACLDVMCPVGQRCVGGTCVEPCSGVVCPHGQSCRAGRCVEPCAGVMCNAREVCVNGMCVPACQCRPCAMGLQCQPDGYCTQEDCVGVTCPTGAYCDRGMCRDACETGPDTRLCPSGERCEEGQCVASREMPRPDGGVRDGGGPGDGGAPRDSGPVLPPQDGGPRADGGAADSGGGTFGPRGRGGCVCDAPGAAGARGLGSLGALLGALLGLVAARRRKAPPAHGGATLRAR